MGLVGALSSALMGRWSEYFGIRHTLLYGMVAMAIFLAIQGMATTVAVLATLMVLSGLATGAMRPVTSSIITRIVAEADRGKAFGIATSTTAFGWALGPMVGAYTGSAWGFRAVFFITAVFFVLVAVWTWHSMANIDIEEPSRRAWRSALTKRLAQRRERKL